MNTTARRCLSLAAAAATASLGFAALTLATPALALTAHQQLAATDGNSGSNVCTAAPSEQLLAYTGSTAPKPTYDSATHDITLSVDYFDETAQSAICVLLNGKQLSSSYSSFTSTPSLDSATPTYLDTSVHPGGSHPPTSVLAYTDTVSFPASMLNSSGGANTIKVLVADGDGQYDGYAFSYTTPVGLPIDAAAGGIGIAVLAGAGLVFISRRRRVRA